MWGSNHGSYRFQKGTLWDVFNLPYIRLNHISRLSLPVNDRHLPVNDRHLPRKRKGQRTRQHNMTMLKVNSFNFSTLAMSLMAAGSEDSRTWP
jgi:hypothetical protein